jgi:hypothetical protein
VNSTAQIHTSVTVLTSRELMCQHASHISVVAHISSDVTSREVTSHEMCATYERAAGT